MPTPVGSYVNRALGRFHDLAHQRLNYMAYAAGVTAPVVVANTTAERRLAAITVPPAFFVPGGGIHLKAAGIAGNSNSTPTMTWRLRVGPTTLTGVIVGSLAFAASASRPATTPWFLDLILNCRSFGATGTLMAAMSIQHTMNPTAGLLSISNPTAAVTVDTTKQNLVELTFQWSASAAANSLTIHSGLFLPIPSNPAT